MTVSKSITGIIEVNLMEEQLYWIEVDCTDVPNKVATECIMNTSKAQYACKGK